MKDSLRQQFQRLALRLNELDAMLSDPKVAGDIKRFRELTREHSEVSSVVVLWPMVESRYMPSAITSIPATGNAL